MKLEAVRAALLRDVFGLFALGGVYLVNAPRVPPPAGQTVRQAGFLAYWSAILDLCGFETVAGVRRELRPGGPAIEGRVLDLTRIGVDAWLDAIVSGTPPRRALRPEELERELLAVLTGWHEDGVLAGSPLLQHAPLVAAMETSPSPEALRQAMRAALARARVGAAPQQELAYRALELAYLDKRTSHERAAERLSVSPSTFYRLLKRGVQGLAATLAD